MSTKPPIDAGEGYRLLEPGRTAQHGKHECIYAESHPAKHWGPLEGLHGAVVQEDWTAQLVGGVRYYIREPIPEASEARWIPVAEHPVPESGWIGYIYKGGKVNGYTRDARLLTQRERDQIEMWIRWPEPPDTPKPSEPKRVVYRNVHAISYQGGGVSLINPVDLITLLPDDVHPDYARKAREECLEMMGEVTRDDATRAAYDAYQRIFNILKEES